MFVVSPTNKLTNISLLQALKNDKKKQRNFSIWGKEKKLIKQNKKIQLPRLYESLFFWLFDCVITNELKIYILNF